MRGKYDFFYVSHLEESFPRFLHDCYTRYASTTVAGSDASIPFLCFYMNEKARIEYKTCEIRGNLHMTTHHFHTFFKIFKGSIKEPTTKPCLTNEHITQHDAFARIQRQRLKYELRSVFLLFFGQKVVLYCFQKKKMKHLPPHSLKDPVKVFQVQPKTHSHRFPTKVTMKRNLMGRYCLKG